MNIVVTGATSFIGSALINELQQLGHQIFAVVRPGSTKIKELLLNKPGIHIVELELKELDLLVNYIQTNCDMFIHFGWDGAGSANRKIRDLQQQNVKDSLKALTSAKHLGCKRFLFSGSQAEYGIRNQLLTETTECHPVSEYGKAKLDFCQLAMAECEKWRAAGESDMEYIHARIFSVYGPGDHQGSLIQTCIKAFLCDQEVELGTCEQKWNFLYIDDLVRGLVHFITYDDTKRIEGIYNIAGMSSDTRPLKEYIEKIHKLCGGQGKCIYGVRPANAEGEAQLIPDISKFQKLTAWKAQISFEEGIATMMRKKCLACKGNLEITLLELDHMPASAQNMPDLQGIEDDFGIKLNLCQCSTCGLVQFDCTPVSYYRDVIRSGGFSTTMVKLRQKQYQHLIDRYHLEGKRFLEVGCGRGEFLSVLKQFPVDVSGIEHNAQLVDLAREQGLNVWQLFTETEDTLLDVSNGQKYDVFLSFNFLEHQPEPEVMLNCIYHNLTENGMGLITVPSFEYILQHDGYYELIRDHLAYYTFETLETLLVKCGFEVLEQEIVNRDTLSVIVKKRPDLLTSAEQPRPNNLALNVEKLKASRSIIDAEMRMWVSELKKQGKKMAIWGASHQGFTLAATTVLGSEAVYIIDSAPFKQGKYAPASHLPIVSPDYFHHDPVEVILIVAPGYTEEIKTVITKQYGVDVEIFTLRSNHMERLK